MDDNDLKFLKYVLIFIVVITVLCVIGDGVEKYCKMETEKAKTQQIQQKGDAK